MIYSLNLVDYLNLELTDKREIVEKLLWVDLLKYVVEEFTVKLSETDFAKFSRELEVRGWEKSLELMREYDQNFDKNWEKWLRVYKTVFNWDFFKKYYDI